MTPQRRAVLSVVRGSRSHLTAEEIHREVQVTAPSVGVATVYRTLDLLARHGEILELKLGADAASRYDGNTDRHDHVICRSCGAVADVTIDLPDRVVADAAHATGATIDGYDLQFLGRCATCAAAS